MFAQPAAFWQRTTLFSRVPEPLWQGHMRLNRYAQRPRSTKTDALPLPPYLWSMKACRSSNFCRDGSVSGGGLWCGIRLSNSTAASRIDTCTRTFTPCGLEHFPSSKCECQLTLQVPRQDLSSGYMESQDGAYQGLHLLIMVHSMCMPPDRLQAQKAHSIFQPT